MISMDRDIPPAEAGRGPQRGVRVAMPRDKQVTWWPTFVDAVALRRAVLEEEPCVAIHQPAWCSQERTAA